MQEYHKISFEDWKDQQECTQQLAGAIFALLHKLELQGLKNCSEFDKGLTAIERWKEQNLRAVERLNDEIAQLEGKL